jgi:hypothetical protein
VGLSWEKKGNRLRLSRTASRQAVNFNFLQLLAFAGLNRTIASSDSSDQRLEASGFRTLEAGGKSAFPLFFSSVAPLSPSTRLSCPTDEATEFQRLLPSLREESQDERVSIEVGKRQRKEDEQHQ